jgi:hypothetical protein
MHHWLQLAAVIPSGAWQSVTELITKQQRRFVV